MRKLYFHLHVLIFIIIGITAVSYFNFTAEDAYITYRYAENWVNKGSLVYNEGEPINAMTSPLHAILSAGVFYITGHTVVGNKIVALLLLFFSSLLVWDRFRNHPALQLLAIILMVMPPSVLLWTVGGLETPILLFLATLAAFLADRTPPFSLTLLLVTFLLAGLGFLTRYDSILFFTPVLLYMASKARSIKHIVIALFGAAVLPAAWLSFSMLYYGDLLPTSFYVKTPEANAGHLILNGQYIFFYLLYVGIIPTVVLAFVLLRTKHGIFQFLFARFKTTWWLYLAILFELMYGLTMATHHMMFSFRFFVPYLPSAVILVLDLLRHASESTESTLVSAKSAVLLPAFLLCLALFQVYQIAYTYNTSVNGISAIGEYRSLGVREYIRFMQLLRQEALDIEEHWKTIRTGENRRPRIITYAAGMLPYTFRDSYIYEKLVSYRHCHERHNQGLHADYLHILAPRLGEVKQQLPGSRHKYSLVSSYEMSFDGSTQAFLVYYNSQPEEHNLSVGINEPCEQNAAGVLTGIGTQP